MKSLYIALLALSALVGIAGSVSAATTDARDVKRFFEQREREGGGPYRHCAT